MRIRVSKIWIILRLSFMDGPFSAHYMLPVVASLSSALSLSAHCCRRPPHLTTPWKGARGQEPSISPTLYLYNNSEGKKRPYLLIWQTSENDLILDRFSGSPWLCTWTRQTANLLMMCFAETPSEFGPTLPDRVSGDPRILISCTKSVSALFPLLLPPL